MGVWRLSPLRPLTFSQELPMFNHLTPAGKSVVECLRLFGPTRIPTLSQDEQNELMGLVHAGIVEYKPGYFVALSFAAASHPFLNTVRTF